VLWGRKDDEATSVTNQEISPGLVSADYLNIRMQPNGNANLVSDPLPKGTKLRIINHAGNWLKVKVDIEGWVSRNWVEEI
jgi:N-acetylmuramoyl-L-alanine amidase